MGFTQHEDRTDGTIFNLDADFYFYPEHFKIKIDDFETILKCESKEHL
jgi:hypothetical protein